MTPAQLHEEVNAAAIGAGKHIYSEKPLTMTADAARALGERAAERGLVLAAAPSVMVFPQIGMVFEQLGTGRLGPPVAAAGAAFGGVPPWEGFASDPRPYFAKGVGPLVDIGVYPLHALTGILGPARRVAAFGRRTRGSFEVADGPAVTVTGAEMLSPNVLSPVVSVGSVMRPHPISPHCVPLCPHTLRSWVLRSAATTPGRAIARALEFQH